MNLRLRNSSKKLNLRRTVIKLRLLLNSKMTGTLLTLSHGPWFTQYLGKRLRSGKVVNETVKRKENSKQKNPSNLRQLRNGKRLPSPKQKNLKVTTNPPNSTKSKPDQVSPNSPKISQTNPQSSQTQTSPTGTTASKRIRDMWTNLNEPISYSGNSAAILNKINSFK